MSTQPGSAQRPQDRGGSSAVPTAPLNGRRIAAGYVGGAFSAIGGIVSLVAAERYDAINGGDLILFGIPIIFGVLSIYFTWLIHANIRLEPWMRPMVTLGYLGAVLQVLVGAVVVYAAFQMPSSDGWQPLVLLFGLGAMAAAAALLLAVEQVDRRLKGKRLRGPRASRS